MATEKTVTFGAVGDIQFCGACAENMRAYGNGWLMEKMIPTLRRADVLFGNMESVTLPPEYPDDQIDGRGMVSEFDGTAALKEAGFDFMNLAANHVLDGGTLGMFHTKKVIEAIGIATAGVGRTQAEARRLTVIEKAGLRWGFLCYCEDSNYTLAARGPGYAYYTPRTVLADIRKHRASVDVLVVSIHADLEFMETPAAPRRDAGRQFARAGATLVLMHHPHVPQGVERIGDSLVAYSLGNFAFDAHSSRYMKSNGPYTGFSFVLLAEVSKRGVESFQRVPLKIAEPPEERPFPLEGEEARRLLAYFDELDRKVADDAIVKANWRAKALWMLERHIRQIRELEDGRPIQHLLGKTLFVAENRSWAAEACRALREQWQKKGGRVDRLHRPSHAFDELMKPRPQPAPPAQG